ncbi:MAG: hypothetical protein IT340_03420 [Chloroflexi bacterium]|nr:hypothetical protein [Chloroflexota bacterium]
MRMLPATVVSVAMAASAPGTELPLTVVPVGTVVVTAAGGVDAVQAAPSVAAATTVLAANLRHIRQIMARPSTLALP